MQIPLVYSVYSYSSVCLVVVNNHVVVRYYEIITWYLYVTIVNVMHCLHAQLVTSCKP